MAAVLACGPEIVDGIRTTSFARTLLDLAEVVTRRQLERAVEEALVSRELDVRAIDDGLARANGRRGAATLRAVLDDIRPGTTTTRNDLEEAFLQICRAANTPPDAVNHWIAYPEGAGAEADFVWHRQSLIAEVDGRATHLMPQAMSTTAPAISASPFSAGAWCASAGVRSRPSRPPSRRRSRR